MTNEQSQNKKIHIKTYIIRIAFTVQAQMRRKIYGERTEFTESLYSWAFPFFLQMVDISAS